MPTKSKLLAVLCSDNNIVINVVAPRSPTYECRVLGVADAITEYPELFLGIRGKPGAGGLLHRSILRAIEAITKKSELELNMDRLRRTVESSTHKDECVCSPTSCWA